MTEKKNSRTHEQIKYFRLDQTGPYSLSDPVFSSGTKILCHIVGDCSHHRIIHKDRKLICFGGSGIACHGCSSHGIDNGLHGELSDAHDRHLKAHRETGFQMDHTGRFQIPEILPMQMENREFFPSHDQTEHSGKKLRKNRRPGSS